MHLVQNKTFRQRLLVFYVRILNWLKLAKRSLGHCFNECHRVDGAGRPAHQYLEYTVHRILPTAGQPKIEYVRPCVCGPGYMVQLHKFAAC